MKRLLAILFLACGTYYSIAQPNCEQREEKLVQSFGTFSAAYLYNTYGIIGSIADGFGNDVYTATAATDLLEAQKKLMDNIVKVLEELNTGGYLKDVSKQAYNTSLIDIVRELKKQTQLFLEYVDSKSRKKLELYEAQRKKNWSAISKLMGIQE